MTIKITITITIRIWIKTLLSPLPKVHASVFAVRGHKPITHSIARFVG